MPNQCPLTGEFHRSVQRTVFRERDGARIRNRTVMGDPIGEKGRSENAEQDEHDDRKCGTSRTLA